MALYDTESFIKEVLTIYKANLNTEITTINTEKGDFEIDAINNNAWYFQGLSDKVLSYSNFIVYGLENSPEVIDSQGYNSVEKIKLFFEVCLPDKGSAEAEHIIWKLLRYQRALKEIGFKNFDKLSGGAKLLVSSLKPTSFQLKGKLFRCAGVNLTAALTAR